MAQSLRGLLKRYRIEIAETPEALRDAQRLRFQVFANELGAKLPTFDEQLDRDRFDEYCDHILVREQATGDLVACTRVLGPEGATKTGGYYSQTEFNMQSILKLEGRAVEVGRTCVASGYRNGAVLGLLWQGIGRMVVEQKVDYLFGCASVPLLPDPVYARAVIRRLLDHYRADESVQVHPLKALPNMPEEHSGSTPSIPPLIRTYINSGALACGEACWDPDFKVADVFMLLSLRALNTNYSSHFLGTGGDPLDDAEPVRA